MKRAKKNIVVQNRLGLHARPAAQLVQLANKFSSDIYFQKGGDQVNGKSIMGVLMLAAAQGTEIEVSAEGEDADQAVVEIENLFSNKFGEE